MSAPRAGRSWRHRLLAVALSLLVALLAGEVLVRVLVGAPLPERLPLLMMRANRHRGWMMVPGRDHYTYQHRVHVNAHGLRGPEIGPKAPGTVRVLALGDSLVYGQGVADDATIPALLESTLVARDPQARRWEVINGGHRAYDTRQELGLVEELATELQPDIVLLFWFWNDVIERDIETTYERLSARGEVAFDTGDRLQGWSRVEWEAEQLLRRSAFLMFLYDARQRWEATPWPAEVFAGGIARLEGYLLRFAALGKCRGFRPVFVAIPEANLLIGADQSGPLTAEALALAARLGFPTLDLLPPMQELVERRGELPVLPFDGHYRPDANRAMAEAVAAFLLR
ncbi:MAG: SGNH/GDSL hydrolase family protein [Planctomycetota bacterium]